MPAVPRTAGEIDALWDFTDPAGSERRFKDAAARLEPDGLAYAEVATQIARALGLQERFAEADLVLDEVERRLPSGPSRLRVRYLLERGRVLNSSGHPERARPLFVEALDAAAQAAEEFYAVDAAHMVAIASAGDEQLEWNRRGLAMAAAGRDPRARGWKASLLNNLGWALHERGERVEAQRCFEEALQLRIEQGNAHRIRHARWAVAHGLRSLGRIEEALRIQLELQTELAREGREDQDVVKEIEACRAALVDSKGS